MALPTCQCIAGSTPFDRLSDIFCALRDTEGCTVPTLLAAFINDVTVTLVFDVPVTGGDGFTGMVEATPALFFYQSGSGTDTLVFDSDTSAEPGDTVTLDYAPGDVANGNCPLEPIEDFPVTNETGLDFSYLRPDGVSTFLRPDGTSVYLRP